MRLLEDSKIEELLKERENSNEAIEKNSATIQENNINVLGLDEKIKILNIELEMLSGELQSTKIDTRDKSLEISNHKRRVEEINKILSDNERSRRIEEIYEEQDDFYKSLTRHIKATQDNLEAGLGSWIELVKPENAVHSIKRRIENNVDFRDENIYLREVKNTYENSIRRLCEKKVDNHRIDLLEGSAPQDYLARECKKTPIANFWQQ